MKRFWCIRPIDNGYVNIGYDEYSHEFIEIHKADKLKNAPLYFLTQEEADDFINLNLAPDKYISEWYEVSEELICLNCGMPLEIKWREELSNGDNETICSCSNLNCSSDWRIVYSTDCTKVERFFFG